MSGKDRCQRAEIRGQRSEDRGKRKEKIGKRKAERADDRGWKSDVGSRGSGKSRRSEEQKIRR
jgi:hypothetical protein